MFVNETSLTNLRRDLAVGQYAEDIADALAVYDELLGAGVWINVNDAAELRPTEDMPYAARSDSLIRHAGGVAARLTVIAFAPHDGTGRERTGERPRPHVAAGYRARTNGPSRQAIYPWRSPGYRGTEVSDELHLTVLTDDLAANDGTVLHAGSLDGMGRHVRDGSLIERVTKVATVGQRETDFLDALEGRRPAVPTATVTIGEYGEGMPQQWLHSRDRAYVNPYEGVLQVAGFVLMDFQQRQQFGQAFAELGPQLPLPLQPLD